MQPFVDHNTIEKWYVSIRCFPDFGNYFDCTVEVTVTDC